MLILNLARSGGIVATGAGKEDRMQAGPLTAAVTREYRMRDPGGPPKQVEDGANRLAANTAFPEKTDLRETAARPSRRCPQRSVPELPSLESVRAQRVAERRVSDAARAAQSAAERRAADARRSESG